MSRVLRKFFHGFCLIVAIIPRIIGFEKKYLLLTINSMEKPRGRRKNLVPGLLVFLCFSLFLFSSCSETQNSKSNPDKVSGFAEKKTSESQDSFTLLNSFPHDRTAFTQGFAYRDGFLYESTGLYGKSSLRKTNPATGKVLAKIDLPREFSAKV